MLIRVLASNRTHMMWVIGFYEGTAYNSLGMLRHPENSYSRKPFPPLVLKKHREEIRLLECWESWNHGTEPSRGRWNQEETKLYLTMQCYSRESIGYLTSNSLILWSLASLTNRLSPNKTQPAKEWGDSTPGFGLVISEKEGKCNLLGHMEGKKGKTNYLHFNMRNWDLKI